MLHDTKNSSSNEILVKWQVANNNLQTSVDKLQDIKNQLQKKETDLKNWNGAKTLLELLKNIKLEKRKDFILNVINQALKDIFESDYRLDIQPRDTKGKSAASTQKYDIIFYQNNIEIARNDELLTSNGGGVLSIASLFFKILIGYLYSKNKFYIFDEALSQVSPQYRERLSLFLKEFCDTYDFTLVIVSQTEELEEHADIVYEVDSSLDDNNVPLLYIKNTYGELPNEKYFFSEIENFQSIKKISFKYKGFTIIRGPNNSGKSATLRAIEALLFNNFNVNLYPRKNPGGRKLTTSITFGYVDQADGKNQKSITLKYKSSKVMFVIDGEEYFGKNLAADKLKEAVEDIGFRYIDVKSAYKNFKGALKEQTERIAYTNQYDGLFLIGSKVTDSEKIFSFLFNTENIALAIARAKEKMLDFQKEHKELQIEIDRLNVDILKFTYYSELYQKLYYVAIIQEHLETKKSFNRIQNTKTHLELLIHKINLWLQGSHELNQFLNLIQIRQTYKESLNSTHEKIEIFKNLIQKLESRNQISSYLKDTYAINLHEEEKLKLANIINDLNQIIMISTKSDAIYNYINTLRTKEKLNAHIGIIKGILPRLTWGIEIKQYLILKDQILRLQNNLNMIQQKIEELNENYHLQICEKCQGKGVVAC